MEVHEEQRKLEEKIVVETETTTLNIVDSAAIESFFEKLQKETTERQMLSFQELQRRLNETTSWLQQYKTHAERLEQQKQTLLREVSLKDEELDKLQKQISETEKLSKSHKQRNLELESKLHEIETLQAANASVKRESLRLKAILTEKNATIESLEKKLSESSGSLPQRKEIEEVKEENQSLRKEIEELSEYKTKLEALEQEKGTLKEQLERDSQNYTTQIISLRRHITALQNQLQQSKKDTEALEKSIETRIKEHYERDLNEQKIAREYLEKELAERSKVKEQMETTKAELKEAKSKLSALETDHQALMESTRDYQPKDAKIKELEAELQAMKTEQGDSRKSRLEFSQKISSLHSELKLREAQLEESRRESSMEIEQLKNEIERLKAEKLILADEIREQSRGDYSKEISSREQVIIELKQKLQGNTTELEKLKTELKNVEEEKTVLNIELQQMRENSSAEQVIKELEEKLRANANESEKLRNELNKAKEDKLAFDIELQQLRERHLEDSKEISSRDQTILDLQANVEWSSKQLEELRQKLERWNGTELVLHKELEQLRNELDNKFSEISSRERVIKELNDKLQAANIASQDKEKRISELEQKILYLNDRIQKIDRELQYSNQVQHRFKDLAKGRAKQIKNLAQELTQKQREFEEAHEALNQQIKDLRRESKDRISKELQYEVETRKRQATYYREQLIEIDVVLAEVSGYVHKMSASLMEMREGKMEQITSIQDRLSYISSILPK